MLKVEFKQLEMNLPDWNFKILYLVLICLWVIAN